MYNFTLFFSSIKSSICSKKKKTGQPDHSNLVHGSGLAIDCLVSSLSSNVNYTGHHLGGSLLPIIEASSSASSLSGAQTPDVRYPLTVTPINPPQFSVKLTATHDVVLCVVNHGPKPIHRCQLMFHRSSAKVGFVPVGTTSAFLGTLDGNGGMSEVKIAFVATLPGLWAVGGCAVLDVMGGREVPQPDLFVVLVEGDEYVDGKEDIVI
mmetsp:Transcript_21285/g.48345  ORF Transcript_21285/g.48345 Transcript_21285/m.48345 type:complete len:208 (-) Transcript_21285:43-666(-)